MSEYYDHCISDDTIHSVWFNRSDYIHSLKAEILSLRAELEYYKSLVREFEIIMKKNIYEVEK